MFHCNVVPCGFLEHGLVVIEMNYKAAAAAAVEYREKQPVNWSDVDSVKSNSFANSEPSREPDHFQEIMLPCISSGLAHTATFTK